MNIDTLGAINVARTGTPGGAPLVFLHPVGLDLSWWGDQFAAFGQDYDVIALDMPGHGLSATPEAPPTLDLMATVVADVLTRLRVGPAHVVGLSVGGMIAQTLALRRPALVSSLSLVGTLCTFPDEVRAVLQERARVARTEGMARIAELSNERWLTAEFRARRPDMITRSTRSLLQQPGEFHARMWEMIATLELENQLGAIACPTLVVTGDADVNAPPAAAQKIANAIAGAQLEIMPGIGHFAPFEVPGAFNDILRKFLARASAS